MQKTSSINKAKNYLNDTPFKVQYYESDLDGHQKLEDPIYEQEYPDFIPQDKQAMMIGDKSYIVLQTIFVPEKNVVIIRIADHEKYTEQYISKLRPKNPNSRIFPKI